MDTKDDGKMLKRIFILVEGRVPDRNARGWKIEGQKGRVTRKGCTRLRGRNLKWEACMAQKELWSIAEKKMLEDRRTWPKEDGHLLREHQTTHKETCLSSRLREDVEGEDEEREYVNKEAEEEESESGKREERNGKGGD